MAAPTSAAAAGDAFVGLGSNLGDRAAEIESACAELAQLPSTTLLAVSSLFSSAPLDAPGGDYLNAVARLRTALSPLDLLHALQAIEARHGRLRPFAGAPRTLDLDLLLYGQRRLRQRDLALPHPRMHQRAFVLRPLLDVAPAARVPGRGAVRPLLRAVRDQRVAPTRRHAWR